LMYVGARMLISDFAQVTIGVSLGVIATVLSSSIVASILFPPAAKQGDGGEQNAKGDNRETRAA
jgi:hypothetical protein